MSVDFLDSQLCSNLDEILKLRDFMYNNSFPHNLLYAFNERISTSVRYLNKNADYPKSEEDFICFMVFACMIVDGIREVSKSLKINDIPETNILSFHIYPEIEFINQLTDKDIFYHIRSLIFAHPYETNHNKTFRDYFGTQVSPWVIVNRDLSYDNSIKEPIGFRTYTETKDSDNSDTRDIIISFEDLKAYIKSQYDKVALIIDELKTKIQIQREEWKKVKINRNQSPVDVLKEIESILSSRHQEVYNIQRLIDYLTLSLICSENEKNVGEYREAIIKMIPDLCDAVDNMDNDKRGNIEDCLLHLPTAGMPQNTRYYLEKIFNYLDEDGDLSRRKDNHDYGLCMLKHFCRELADNWVTIKPESMSYREIFLLVNTTLFLENRAQMRKGVANG